MKIIKKNFFTLLIVNVIILKVFFGQLIAKDDIPGRKIKKQKAYEKKLIKKNILITAANLLGNNNRGNKEIVQKNINIDNLSQSAQDRYKLENNFIQGVVSVEDKKLIHSSKNNTDYILPFLKTNYGFIEKYLLDNNIQKNSLLYYITLLFLNNTIAQGNNLKKSLAEVVLKIKNYPDNFQGIIDCLQKLDNNFQFDDIKIKLLKNTLLYNGSDRIEIDRVINRFYNNANRQPVVLIIQQYSKNDFTIKENNTTYGELAPSKDIYEKLVHNKKKLEDENMRDYFQLSRRDMPEKKPNTIEYYIVVPKIKSNITEYMTIDRQTQAIKKIETIINNLDRDYFYSLSVMTEKELHFLV
jgi:hypothetical protein